MWALRAGGWGREPCPLGMGQPGQERRTEATLGRELALSPSCLLRSPSYPKCELQGIF